MLAFEDEITVKISTIARCDPVVLDESDEMPLIDADLRAAETGRMVPPVRLELTTPALRMRCSTN